MEREQRIKLYQRFYDSAKNKLASYGLTLDNNCLICDAILALPNFGPIPLVGSDYKSNYFGVTYYKPKGGFLVRCNGKYYGYYKSEIEAALKWDSVVKQFGYNKPLNFGI